MFHYEITITEHEDQVSVQGYSPFALAVFLAAIPNLIDDAPGDVCSSHAFLGYIKDSLKPLFLSTKARKAFEASPASSCANMGMYYKVVYDMHLELRTVTSSMPAGHE